MNLAGSLDEVVVSGQTTGTGTDIAPAFEVAEADSALILIGVGTDWAVVDPANPVDPLVAVAFVSRR
ncbi:hypothetical protein AB0L59_28120 [Streptomyces sp. NPDC052109]|uniref:hypothetical protein n=1 Tax=Streptomyces sp. NPDC052109 TaxID=3155527 RepID=UPI0034402568